MPISGLKAQTAPKTSGSQELAPFCGLHKTGGWAMQQLPTSSAPAIVMGSYEEEYERMPDLSFSQETLASSQRSSWLLVEEPPSRKRTYEDEVEDDMDALFEGMHSQDEVLTHSSVLPRLIATPRTSRKPALSGQAAMMTSGDFDEASFLTPMEVME
jgi:hypothetical protein